MDRIPELQGEIERLRAAVRATLPAGLLAEDEVPEQHASGLGLHCLRVDYQKVITEEAFLLVTDLVGLQHLLSALCARHNERHRRRVAW